jgi:hypothetical protein
MKKYPILLLILVLNLFLLKPSLASVNLITPLALSSNDIHVGESLLAYANWNETVDSSLIEYNSTSSDLVNTTTGIETNNNTWTNYTIDTDSNWLLGTHPVKIYVLNTLEEGDVETSTDATSFNVWGYSKASIKLSLDSITSGHSVTITCRVVNANISNPLEGYYVEAVSDIEGDIDTIAGLTNSSGYKEGIFTPTENGTHVITCVLHDDNSKFYTAYSNGSTSLAVIQPEIPSFVGRGILSVEKALLKSGLIEMPKGLNATLKDYNIKINNEENSTMEFSLYIGNQLVLKDSIPALDSYTINYSTILDWKETYHLNNLHKVRIQVEDEHGFKSLINQNYTDVYADIVVNKKYPKGYEINVSSQEHLQKIFMEGNIPPGIDLDKVKLYHWNGEKYEDVTDSAEYNVSINKQKRRFMFTVPSLSTQSFLLMEGGIETTTASTTVEATTTVEKTTTVKTTIPKVTTTIKTCPTCPTSSNWTECVNEQKSRTKYKCDETTDYECKTFKETEICATLGKSYYFVIVAVVILVAVFLVWEFKVLGKIPRKKFKYRYKPR